MSRQKIKPKTESIDFSTLPYSFQCRLIDLTPPITLWNLRRTGHTISKLTSRRGYFARSLCISRFNCKDELNAYYQCDDFLFRHLAFHKALTFKHIYVKNTMGIRIDVNAEETDKQKLRSLIIPMYTHIVFADDCYTLREMVMFIHPKLLVWHLVDSVLLQTRENLRKLLFAISFFIRTRENKSCCNGVEFGTLRCPVLHPEFYKDIENVVARFRPAYDLVRTGDDFVIVRKQPALFMQNDRLP